MIPPRLMAKALAKITGQVPRAVAQPSGDHLPLQNQLTVVTTHNRYFVVCRTQRRKGSAFLTFDVSVLGIFTPLKSRKIYSRELCVRGDRRHKVLPCSSAGPTSSGLANGAPFGSRGTGFKRIQVLGVRCGKVKAVGHAAAVTNGLPIECIQPRVEHHIGVAARVYHVARLGRRAQQRGGEGARLLVRHAAQIGLSS